MKYSRSDYIVKKINRSFVAFAMFMGITTLSFAVSLQPVAQTCDEQYSGRKLKLVSFSAHFNNRITCDYTQGDNDVETTYEFGKGYKPSGENWLIGGEGTTGAVGQCRVPANQPASHCQFKKVVE